ncbi:MAG: Hsp70 family protein, partial [Pseudomonadota bacterium]
MNSLALFVPEMLNVKKLKNPVRVLGIDLGTTNTSATQILWSPESPGSVKAQCLEINQKLYGGNGDKGYSSTLVPSVVALINNAVYVGEGAKQLRAHSEELSLLQNKNIFYECKNDIGIRKTYAAAPEGYRSASEISAKILELVHGEAIKAHSSEINRVVVTVPASFQVAQRQDTLLAADYAGLEIGEGDLLDEPIAAFIDYLISYRDVLKDASGSEKNLLVFDFGGGTCDVSIFNLSVPEAGYPVKVFPLAASRYHRLGGGDIDRAIVYEILIPEILSINNLSKFDLTYEDKKEYFEPLLLGIAEALKMQLCDEMTRLKQKASYDGKDKKSIGSILPGIFTFNVRGRRFILNVPRLNAQQFEDVLAPFLDEDLLYARETEYR